VKEFFNHESTRTDWHCDVRVRAAGAAAAQRADIVRRLRVLIRDWARGVDADATAGN
jgi:hypothetical protein